MHCTYGETPLKLIFYVLETRAAAMKEQVTDTNNSGYGEGRESLASKETPNCKTQFSLLNDPSSSAQKAAAPSIQVRISQKHIFSLPKSIKSATAV